MNGDNAPDFSSKLGEGSACGIEGLRRLDKYTILKATTAKHDGCEDV
jgi:hypothetical protein